MSLNILMVPFGTEGDVFPYVGLGIALADRGHGVTLIANEYFRPLAERHGLGFAATGTSMEYRAALDNPHILTHLVRGALPLRHWFCAEIPKQYQAIADRLEPERTLVLASGFAVGARIAHEKHGVPWAVIALQPLVLPMFAKLQNVPDWIPEVGKRFFWRFGTILGEAVFGPYIRPLRTDLGLPPIRHLPPSWWLSPKRVIGLFPEWYAGPHPRWPIPIQLTGFVAYDATPDAAEASSHDELESFLSVGAPPIVFTPGSGIRFAGPFFRAAIEACKLLRKRGLLLTRHRDQLPGELPAAVRHFDYVPLGELLPRAACIVHHGGIGTTARAMAAGVPQLVVPRIYDQPDNAKRIRKLGIGDSMRPTALRGPALAQKLSNLLNSREVVIACRSVALKCSNDPTLHRTCEVIERLVRP